MLIGETTHPDDPSSLMGSLPYDYAVRRLYEGRVSKEELLAGLQTPVSSHTKQIENRVKTILMARPRDHWCQNDILSNLGQRVPSWLCEEISEFKAHKKYISRVIQYYDGPLGSHSVEWATSLINKSPDIAAYVCSRPEMGHHYSVAFHNIVIQSMAPTSQKKIAKSEERFLSRAFNRLAKASQALNDEGVDPYGYDALLSLANSFFGGMRPLMIMLLGSHYRSTYIYLSSIVLGMYGSDFKSQRHETLLDNKEIRALVLETCPFIEVLGEESLLAVEASGILANAVARLHAWRQHFNISCAQDFDKLIVAERDKNRDLRDEVTKLKGLQAKSERLSKVGLDKLSENAEIARLRAENVQLQRNLRQASDIISLREQKIIRMTAQLSEPKLIGPIDQQSEPLIVFPVEIESAVPTTFEEDLRELKAIKAILVGGHVNFFNKIRRLLPAWEFYSPDETSVDESKIIRADLVVFFTAYVSHQITEKALKICRQRNIPICYATRVNPPSFLKEIAGHVRKQSNPCSSGAISANEP